MIELILASTSATRARLLRAAGVAVRTEASQVDEDDLKAALRGENASASECAEALAELKAVRVSRRYPQALVIGADQMLECDEAWFDKPVDMAAARTQLLALRGKAHFLRTAVAVARDGQRLWSHLDSAEMTVRPFSDSFLDDYLLRAGDSLLDSVGAYQLEGLGPQLFTHVRGDYFTVLGLPLLPLLDFLRAHGVVST